MTEQYEVPTLDEATARALAHDIVEIVKKVKRFEEPFGAIEIHEERPGRFRVAYRNRDRGFWWELTEASPELGARAVCRWNSPNYRSLRPTFEALLAGAPDYKWVGPQLDRVHVTGDPFGDFAIVGDGESYKLIWEPADQPGAHVVDLSGVEPEAAVLRVFGAAGLQAYHASSGLDV